MTCNPKWKEIQENLKDNEKAWQRRDLCARVFKMKLDDALNEIKKGALGHVEGLVYTIEFQKRNFHHMFLLRTINTSFLLQTLNNCCFFVTFQITL